MNSDNPWHWVDGLGPVRLKWFPCDSFVPAGINPYPAAFPGLLTPPTPPRHVVASLYANPLHEGHLDYLEAAAKRGRLTVIVNNDAQVRLKGSRPFMGEAERLRIVAALRCVARAVLSADEDRSVLRTLRLLHQLDPVHVFANGGDVLAEGHVREADVCRELGIELAFGVGGADKVQSSSALLRAARAGGEAAATPPPETKGQACK